MKNATPLIVELYQLVDELEALYPGREFAPAGRMLESIGDALAAWAYGLELLPSSSKTRDAKTSDGRIVHIQTTRTEKTALAADEAAHLLVLKLGRTGVPEEVYNGPAARPLAHAGKVNKRGQRPISLATLRSLMDQVPAEARLSVVHRPPDLSVAASARGCVSTIFRATERLRVQGPLPALARHSLALVDRLLDYVFVGTLPGPSEPDPWMLQAVADAKMILLKAGRRESNSYRTSIYDGERWAVIYGRLEAAAELYDIASTEEQDELVRDTVEYIYQISANSPQPQLVKDAIQSMRGVEEPSRAHASLEAMQAVLTDVAIPSESEESLERTLKKRRRWSSEDAAGEYWVHVHDAVATALAVMSDTGMTAAVKLAAEHIENHFTLRPPNEEETTLLAGAIQALSVAETSPEDDTNYCSCLRALILGTGTYPVRPEALQRALRRARRRRREQQRRAKGKERSVP